MKAEKDAVPVRPQADAEPGTELGAVADESLLDARLGELITRLASKQPGDDITDADIADEVKAVRAQRRRSS